MDNYIGKHLLIDCYSCSPDTLEDSKTTLQALSDAAGKIGMEVKDTFSMKAKMKSLPLPTARNPTFVSTGILILPMRQWIFTVST